MEKQSFDDMFEEIVKRKLKKIGFLESGSSLFIYDDNTNVSLIRLGGKKSRKGCIVHILCFRDKRMPTLYEKLPDGLEHEVFSYPIKVNPSDVSSLINKPLRYKSQNLTFDNEIFEYTNAEESEVVDYLEGVVHSVKTLTAWAKCISPQDLVEVIQRDGESAWIENLWVNALLDVGE